MGDGENVTPNVDNFGLIVKKIDEEPVGADDITPDPLKELSNRLKEMRVKISVRVLRKGATRYYPFLGRSVTEGPEDTLYMIREGYFVYGDAKAKIPDGIVPVDLAAISLEIYSNPMEALSGDMELFSSVTFTHPLLWSSPHLMGTEFSKKFSHLSRSLSLLERYRGFIRSLTLLVSVEQVPVMMRASRLLASMGVDPPVTRSDFLLLVELNPMEAKAIKALAAKKALDLNMLSPNEAAVMLIKLLKVPDPEGYKRRRLQRSFNRRKERVGLTLMEMSTLFEVDRVYLWRKVLPVMVVKGLAFRWTFKRGSRDVIVYEANSTIPFIADLVAGYEVELALHRRGLMKITEL